MAFWQSYPSLPILLIVGMVCLWVAYTSWRRRVVEGAGPFALLMMSVGGWIVLSALERISVSFSWKYFWASSQYVFILLVPATYLVFGYAYSGRAKRGIATVVAVLSFMPLIVLSLIATDHIHHAFRREVEYVVLDGVPFLRVVHGPVFWINLVYTYILFAIGTYFLVEGFRRRRRQSYFALGVVLAGLVIPLVANASFLLGWRLFPYSDITPYFLAASCLASATLLFELRIFSIEPIAREFVLESLADGIVVLDRRGRLVDINPAACQLLGKSRTECIGRDVTTLLPGEGGEGEWIRKLDGQTRNFEVRRQTLADGAAKMGSVIRISDITQRKESEKKNAELEARLWQRQKLESLGVMASGIAHDFNNQLVGIMGNLDLARQAVREGANPSEYLEEIHASASQASMLTSQMLDYSGHGGLVIRPLSMSDLIRGTADLVRSMLPNGSRLDLRLRDDLPLIEGSSSQLRQMLINLVSNAAHAICDHSGTVSIRTDLVQVEGEDLKSAVFDNNLSPGSYVALEVIDNGPGITPEDLTRIFEPFYSTRFMGPGLGLAVVLGIVRSHGGTIFVESQPRLRTRFKVLFPPSRVAAPETMTPRDSFPIELAGGTVLVVESDPNVRDITRQILERGGYHVLTIADANLATEMFDTQAHPIDAVIMDMSTAGPDLDGVLAEIRRRAPRVCLVVSTAESEVNLRGRLVNAEAVGYLHKPWRTEDLLSEIARVLSRPEESFPLVFGTKSGPGVSQGSGIARP